MNEITEGSMLRLHEGGLYKIGKFKFSIGESGNWICLVEITNTETGESRFEMVEVTLDLLRDGDLYPPESAELMAGLHESRKRREEKLYGIS